MTQKQKHPYEYMPHYRSMYGLTKTRFQELLRIQNYRCAICRTLPTTKPLCVDHDHSNGTVRGLLCNNCNGMLAFAKDTPRILAMAIVYLEDHGIPFFDDQGRS